MVPNDKKIFALYCSLDQIAGIIVKIYMLYLYLNSLMMVRFDCFGSSASIYFYSSPEKKKFYYYCLATQTVPLCTAGLYKR